MTDIDLTKFKERHAKEIPKVLHKIDPRISELEKMIQFIKFIETNIPNWFVEQDCQKAHHYVEHIKAELLKLLEQPKTQNQ